MPDAESMATGAAGGITVGGALKWAWDNWDTIKTRLGELTGWVKKLSDRPILIVGPGGCGKTTLLHIFAGDRDWLRDTPWVYAESTVQERMPLADDPHVQIVATPGQPHREKTYWQDMQTDLAAGKYRGVVLLTAFGYHSLGQGMRVKNHPLYVPGGKQPTAEFLAKYLPDRRVDELRVLRNLVPHLQACPKPVWLMTLVAKQDLWADVQPTVDAHYRTGDYGAVIQELTASKDAAKFRHELALASLVIANFVTGPGDLLAKNLAGYDQHQQVESVKRLIEVVYGLVEWEGRT